MRLLRAYRDGKSIRLGHEVFSRAQIRAIVETLDIVIFPQVNPDGRHFSMERNPLWRKNRRPAPNGRGSKSIGVDINRNFPFLWRFDRHFAPNTVGSSFKPRDYESYVGPCPASEPETRNVIWSSIAFRTSDIWSICIATVRPFCSAGASRRFSAAIVLREALGPDLLLNP
jgi:carboxypeptidase T